MSANRPRSSHTPDRLAEAAGPATAAENAAPLQPRAEPTPRSPCRPRHRPLHGGADGCRQRRGRAPPVVDEPRAATTMGNGATDHANAITVIGRDLRLATQPGLGLLARPPGYFPDPLEPDGSLVASRQAAPARTSSRGPACGSSAARLARCGSRAARPNNGYAKPTPGLGAAGLRGAAAAAFRVVVSGIRPRGSRRSASPDVLHLVSTVHASQCWLSARLRPAGTPARTPAGARRAWRYIHIS